MENVYISEKAYPETIRHIREIGIEPTVIKFDPRLGEFTGDHPDLRLCVLRGRPVFAREDEYRPDYPGNAAYCAAVFDRFINPRIEGAKVNQGIHQPEEDDEDDIAEGETDD